MLAGIEFSSELPNFENDITRCSAVNLGVSAAPIFIVPGKCQEQQKRTNRYLLINFQVKVEIQSKETHIILPQGNADYISLDHELKEEFCLESK